MNVIKKAWERFKSSVTGRFVKKADAVANPKETYKTRRKRKSS